MGMSSWDAPYVKPDACSFRQMWSPSAAIYIPKYSSRCSLVARKRSKNLRFFPHIFDMMKNFKIAVILSLSNEFISITRGTPPYILYINRLVGMSRNRIRGQKKFWVPARKVGFFWGCHMHPSRSKFKKLKARKSSPAVPLLIPPGPNLQRFLCWTC